MRSDLDGGVELGGIAGKEVPEPEREGVERAGYLAGGHPRCADVGFRVPKLSVRPQLTVTCLISLCSHFVVVECSLRRIPRRER